MGRKFPLGNKSTKEGGGRILLGNNTGGGVVMLFSMRFRCGGVWI